ncbi:MAG: UDP-glucose dehydrogenase family protein [Galactobacter sp.]|uniref:UDP-glucose dehydrogenase family protein n=1 Tax=Galactobacter sp. TaxID=2676125 RepID=UPI0025C37021|nr:UDP-glucose/GDP-mannose dehydrogenase family protein [Galactobacter sp.]
MNISVIGCGYLGAVHAACMAALGHHVIGVEKDQDRITALRNGEPPFYEPGLAQLLLEGRASGRLRFTDDTDAVRDCDVHFVCVGTPQRPDSDAADLRALDAVVTSLLPLLRPGQVVVGKSTVPVGTAARLTQRIKDACHGADLVWNPEFLRESTAVEDTMRPDRLVYGMDSLATPERREHATRVLDEVYAPLLRNNVPRMVTDHATAELVKVAANSFLATKISFINSMAEICHATGGDVDVLADAIGMDARIGRKFLDAGLGFGGGCLPKDIRAFRARSRELGVTSAADLLDAVDEANATARANAVEAVRSQLGGRLEGAKVAVLGATFKPNSDDIRDAPGLDIATRLYIAGAEVSVTDPYGCDNARRAHPALNVVEDLEAAVADADVVLLATGWDEYLGLDPEWLGTRVAGRRVVDGRGVLDAQRWRAAGWTLTSVGRPSVPTSASAKRGSARGLEAASLVTNSKRFRREDARSANRAAASEQRAVGAASGQNRRRS